MTHVRRQFVVYSAELYDKIGAGTLRITAPPDLTQEQYDTFVAKTRADQKEINREYRKQTPSHKQVSTHTEAVKRVSVRATRHLLKSQEMEPVAEMRAVLSEINLKLDAGTGNSTVLLGSSKAGKTTLMMQLFSKYYSGKDFISVLFAENAQIDLYKGKKRLVQANCYEPGLIKMAHFIQKQTNNAYKFCFMLDDIVDKRDDKTLKKLVLSLRNSDISSIVSLQYTNLLAKNSRANVNNIILFRFNNQEAIDLAINQFLKAHFRRLGVAPDDMVDFYKSMTADHGFIYLHPASDSISFHRLPQQ